MNSRDKSGNKGNRERVTRKGTQVMREWAWAMQKWARATRESGILGIEKIRAIAMRAAVAR